MLPSSTFLSLHAAGIDGAAAYVLARLKESGPLHPADLVGDEKLNRNEASRRLRDLRKKNLIQRMPGKGDHDGRSLPYELTTEGRAFISPTAEPAAVATA